MELFRVKFSREGIGGILSPEVVFFLFVCFSSVGQGLGPAIRAVKVFSSKLAVRSSQGRSLPTRTPQGA